MFLEEKHIVDNFPQVFGHRCDYFGKLLYLYLSDGKHRMRIDFLRMMKKLHPIFDKDN